MFGRTLVYVWMEADELEPLINEYLLLGGFARLFDEAWVDPLRWQNEFVEATTIAQHRRSGLWSACE